MKKILPSIAALLLSVFQCLGQEEAQSGKAAEANPEEAKKVADIHITKVFPDENFTDKQETPGMQVYTYEIDQEFAHLEKRLKTFLGEHWAKMEDEEILDVTKKTFEVFGGKVKGIAIYHNTKKVGSVVMMVQMIPPDGADGKAIVTLTYTWQ